MIRKYTLPSLLFASALGLSAFAPARAEVDEYPQRPVRMVVPFAPGGASDFVARIIQPGMTELLGEQVVVDNRAGAAGNIGVENAARATADGYTFLLGNIGTMAINPNYFTKFPIKPLHDLIPVTEVVDVPGCLVVHPKVPVKSVKDLIGYLKVNPGKLNYGSPGPTSANRLEMAMFLVRTGTRATHVPYKGGAGPATIGLLSNEVQMMFVTLPSAITFVKDGRLRMLGIVSPERNPAVSNIPTMREQGIDDVVGSWQGIFVPKGTPRKIVDKLFDVTQKTMKRPEVAKHLADGGVEVVLSKSPADFRGFVEKENARFATVIKDAHIETVAY